jgi:hypothetical protein
MLGLGNALTRIIKFGKSSIFNNAPSTGTYDYGGIVLGVEEYVGEEAGNAIVYIGYPTSIQYPNSSDPVEYFDNYLDFDDGVEYIIQQLSSIQNGSVYDDWEPANEEEFNKIIDFLSGSLNQSLFGSVYTKGFYLAFDSLISSNTAYYTGNMFNGEYYIASREVQNTNPFMFFPIRKQILSLQYNQNINLSDVSLKPVPPEALGNSDLDLNYQSSVEYINDDSLSVKKPDLSPFNFTGVSTKNGIATFTIVGPPMGSDSSQYASKKASLSPPWNSITGDIYAIFYLKLDYYGNSSFNFFQSTYDVIQSLPIASLNERGFYDTSEFVGDYGVIEPEVKPSRDTYLCYAKVKEVVFDDVQNSIDGSTKLVDNDGNTFPKSVIVELSNGNIIGANVCYKFDFDLTVFSFSPLLFSLSNDLGYNKFYIDGITDLISNNNLDASIYDIHINTTSGEKLPKSNWWMKCKIGLLRFVSASYLPSELVITPENLQNVYVPLFPGNSQAFPDKGERFINNYEFSISKYMDKVQIANDDTLSKTAQPVFTEYVYSSLSSLNASTIHSSGDYAFVNTSGQTKPSFFENSGDNGLYLYNGTQWTKQSFSNGQYVNYSGSLYVYVSVTNRYSGYTDSDLFISN